MSVASIIWCDRAPFHTIGNPGEIVQTIEDAARHHDKPKHAPLYVFFDPADPFTGAPTEGPQFVLNVQRISSIVRLEPTRCTCGPKSACTDCPRPAVGTNTANVGPWQSST